MDTSRGNTLHRAGAPAAGGFTLTELLVVVSILGVLMGMLVPSLHEMVTMAQRKAACASNLNTIVKACNQYAINDRRNRLPTVFDSTENPGWQNWGNIRRYSNTRKPGNPACLWLVVAERHCDRSAFLCPEARTTRNWDSPAPDANSLSYDATRQVSTLSYSFISMVRNSQWKDRLAEQMTMSGAPGTLCVLADKNPRCTFDTQNLISYDQINKDAGGKLGDEKKNSLNHSRKGQNIARWDASVQWTEDPNARGGDDVYVSSIESSGDEKKGRRGEMADAFVLP